MAPEQGFVCPSEALADSGDGVRFEVVVRGTRQPAFAVRYRGCVHAYVNRCAHVGSELDWQPGRFFDAEGWLLICSLHGALYDPETGRCVGGPCSGASLARVPVEERQGKVFCALSSTVNKESRNG